MTWRELKQFCNNLPEQFLDNNLILWREDEAITNIDAEPLGEDFYIHEEQDEGCFPETVALDFIRRDKGSYLNGLDDFDKYYDKGHPILMEDF